MPFTPTSAVLAHSLVALDTAVLSLLKPEDALLIHSVSARADRQRINRVNTAGREVLAVYSQPELIWSVRASMIDNDGLADYHPGRSLSATGLAWANGAALPFQFEDTAQAVFIYESPDRSMPAGDLPGIAFNIRLQFGQFASDDNPDTDADGLLDFEEIPAQSAVEVADSVKVALLYDFFNGLPAFGSAPFTAALYGGDPSDGGVELFEPVALDPWTTYDETASNTTRGRNNEAVDWVDVKNYVVNVTHIRFARGGVVIRDVALAAPLEIQPYTGVRAPVNALALTLKWPWDVTASTPSPLPSRVWLTYILGGTREAAGVGAALEVVLSEYDLATDVDTIAAVPATEQFWSVRSAGMQVLPVKISGTNTAGAGGWDIGVVTVTSGGTIVFRRRHSLYVPEDGRAVLNELPVFDLAGEGAA